MKFVCQLVFASLLFAENVNCNCDNTTCRRENNCACASTKSPLPFKNTPQFVTLSFDDAVTKQLDASFLTRLFHKRYNPDGTPVTATFYVPHTYTDYQVVNNLFNDGHEISLNSVSKGPVDYWRTASTNQIKLEFLNNREIIQTFSNVSSRHCFGARIPNLQLSGDATFSAYKKIGVQYDGTCVVSASNFLFPFTLEYPSNQQCFVGKLPKESYHGIWLMPIINLLGKDGVQCNALAGCHVTGTADQIKNWLVGQFNRFYNNNRAPMTLMVSSAWFQMAPHNFQGLQLFLDHLAKNKDVYVVSHREVLFWSVHPLPLASYKTSYRTHSRPCNLPHNCRYIFQEQERMLGVCGKCPDVYPQLGNPEGML